MHACGTCDARATHVASCPSPLVAAFSRRQDVARFCDSVTNLYSNLSKPILDIALYTYKLTTTIGMQGPGNMLGYAWLC